MKAGKTFLSKRNQEQMRKIFLKYALILFVGITAFSCDSFENDDLPDDLQNNPIQTEGDKQTILAGSPAIINLLGNDFVGTQATLTLSSSPIKGTAKVLANGEVLYIPNANFTTGQDFFNYKITNSSTEQTGTVEINVEQDSSNIPCQNGIMTDFATYYMNGGIVSEVEVSVLMNDYFCEDSVDWSTLTVALQGQYGATSVRNQQLVYTILDTILVFNALSQLDQITDYVVYAVYSDGQELGTGLLVINIKNKETNCSFTLQDDNYNVMNDGNGAIFNVLSNDSFECGAGDSSNFFISALPQNGTLEFEHQNFSILTYTPNQDYAGQDQFTYGYCIDNNCSEATVFLFVENDSSCQLTTREDSLGYSLATDASAVFQIPQYIRDSLNISDNDVAFSLGFNALANDETCNVNDFYIEIPNPTAQSGQFVAIDKQLYFVVTPNYTGSVVEEYRIVEVGNSTNVSNTSTIDLIISQ
ncbi:MAG: hypothetical protein ACI85I_000032 [Arenicella sp.]